MTETVVDGVSISASGSETATFSKEADNSDVALILRGDGNTSDVTAEVTGVAFGTSDTVVDAAFTSTQSNIDATTDDNNDKAFRLTSLQGYERVEVTLTNNGSNGTTVSLEQRDY